jgi:hypothetical protein
LRKSDGGAAIVIPNVVEGIPRGNEDIVKEFLDSVRNDRWWLAKPADAA